MTKLLRELDFGKMIISRAYGNCTNFKVLLLSSRDLICILQFHRVYSLLVGFNGVGSYQVYNVSKYSDKLYF